MNRVSLLFSPQAQQPYHIVILHPPRHPMAAAVLRISDQWAGTQTYDLHSLTTAVHQKFQNEDHHHILPLPGKMNSRNSVHTNGVSLLR